MAKGSPSSRNVTKKNNPFAGHRLSETTSGKQHLKPMDPSRKKDIPPGPTLNKDTLSRSATSKSRTEHRTFYDDPVSVRQWAVQTDPNTSADLAGYGFLHTSQSNEYPGSYATTQYPGSFPVPCSSVSHVSFPVSSGFQSDDLSAVCAYPVSHEMTRISRNPIGIDTHSIADPMKNYETWSYPTPTAEDMAYTTSTASYLPFSGSSSIEPRFADWPAGALLPDEELPRSSAQFSSQPVAWSPVLATDPSVSSSYSQGSYLAMQPGTPLSPVAQERDWPASHFASQEEEAGMYPAFSLGEALSVPAACQFEQEDVMSTVKPSRSSHPAPVPGADLWTQEDSHSYAYPGTSFVDLTYARRPSEGETNTTAREHPLYQVGPKEDGLYHCPFAGTEDCTHKPEKLKCNYDKHLDSHLKPYRCKLSTCSTLAFSSTACLLRHEREAHGMHGHGDKPHLCNYPDCERSIQGNGFPRRWNLFDHMKRVHNYTGPPSPPGSTSPTPSSTSSYCQGQTSLPPRKRRLSGSAKPETMKKTKSNSSHKASISPSKRLPSMQVAWQQQKAAINARMAALDPSDTLAMQQIHADYAMLNTMAENIRRQETAPMAH